MNRQTPLLNMVTQYTDQNRISFHMPTHNGGKAFAELSQKLAELDVTELPQTDNLANPKLGILAAQQQLAQAYKCSGAHLLVNGSTCGIQAMLTYSCRRGDTVILDSAVHQSVINTCIVLGLHTTFVKRKVIDDMNIAAPLDPQDVQYAIDRSPCAAAILLTSPTYYGVCSNLAVISDIAKKSGIKLLVDSAHGAHFAFSSSLPATPIESGADMCVVSLHKTLGALNQTAALLYGADIDSARMQECVNLFQTTSPSYILMCVADFVVADMLLHGENGLSGIVSMADRARSEIQTNTRCVCLSAKHASCDPLRLTINFSAYDISGYQAAELLSSAHTIDVEMADMYNIVCIIGPQTPFWQIDALAKAVCTIVGNAAERTMPILNADVVAPENTIYMTDAFYADRKMVPLEQSIGMKAAANVTVYPPGTTVIVCGGVITSGAVRYLRQVQNQGGEIIGVQGGLIAVCV